MVFREIIVSAQEGVGLRLNIRLALRESIPFIDKNPQ
jgi:hypothetical protein